MKNLHLSTLALSTLSLAMVACGSDTPSPAPGDTGSAVPPPAIEEDTGPIQANRTNRESVAAAVLESFARQDWQMLSTFVAPTGVRMTPYTYVNDDSDRVLSPAEIAAFDDDANTYVWGTQEGSGEPISMTNMEYLARYVWDHDYRTAEETIWNAPQNHGSMVDNVQDVYPGATTVEYYFSGFDAQYGGMDWRSLRLVLAQGDDGNYVLYGIIHDEWTP